MRAHLFFGLLLAALFNSVPAYALDPFEIQVYNSEIGKPGEASLETHFNTVVKGLEEPAYPEQLPNHHMSHLTFEGAVGINKYLEAGAYFQSAYSPDGNFRYGGSKLRLKCVLPRAESRPWHLGVNFEVGNIPPEFEEDRWGAEARPIIGYEQGRWTFLLNPILELNLTPGHSAVPSLAPAAKFIFDVASGNGLGLEYYADLGEFTKMPKLSDDEQYLFAAYDLLGGPIEFNLAAGWGLTPSSNAFVMKTIVGFDF